MPEVDEWDKHDAWFTPGAVAEQGLHAARILAKVRARRALDLGAGAGVFGQRLLRVYPTARRVGIEVRPSELPHLRRHYDDAIIGDMFKRRRELARLGADFILSNPPYRVALDVLELALATVRRGGWVLFFLRSTFGSSVDAYRFLSENPPLYEFAVAGRPNMRTGRSAAGHVLGGDFVPHTWLLFRRGASAAATWTQKRLLPPLDGVDLKWRVRPGTELVAPSFSDLYLPIAA